MFPREAGKNAPNGTMRASSSSLAEAPEAFAMLAAQRDPRREPHDPMSETAEHLTRRQYHQRLQPQREQPSDAFAGLLAAAATVLGLMALWLAPFKTGGIAMALAVIALACSRGRDTGARWAFYIACAGWLIGTVLAVLLDRNPLEI
jgi:hypothetical protein